MLRLDEPPKNERPPFQPTEAWIDAFDAQFTGKLKTDMKSFARWRGRSIRNVGGEGDEKYAEDMVAGVIMDTLQGAVTWDPARKSLYQHVRDTIEWRTRNDYQRAKRYRRERMDAPVNDAEKRATRGLVEASLAQDAEDVSAESAIFASEIIAQLRGRAAGDKRVVAYLDAIVAGARTAADIMEHAKMSKRTFRNARDRLARLVEQIDHELIEQGVRV